MLEEAHVLLGLGALVRDALEVALRALEGVAALVGDFMSEMKLAATNDQVEKAFAFATKLLGL